MSANARRCLTIVLAAGEGVRMRSARPKVLHELAGRSMLAHTLSAVLEGAAAISPSSSGRTAKTSRPRRSKPRRGRRSSFSASGGARPTPCSRRAGKSRAATTTFSSSTPTFR